MKESQFKAEKTRLSNLLTRYRNHMITKRIDKSGKSHEIVIREIDEAIELIKNSL